MRAEHEQPTRAPARTRASAPRARCARFAALAALLLAACVAGEVRALEPRAVAAVPPARVRGPFVQAGTGLVARLDQPLGTETSYPTQPFTARVETALRDPRGALVVRAGAQLRGHVADVDSGRRPRIDLVFDTVETVRGPAPVAARVRRVTRYPFRGADELYDPPTRSRLGRDDRNAWDFRITPLGPLHLELTRPLIPPGTLVRRPE